MDKISAPAAEFQIKTKAEGVSKSFEQKVRINRERANVDVERERHAWNKSYSNILTSSTGRPERTQAGELGICGVAASQTRLNGNTGPYIRHGLRYGPAWRVRRLFLWLRA